MNSRVPAPAKWLFFGFALVGRFGDAGGFLLAKTFTGHITGNLVPGASQLRHMIGKEPFHISRPLPASWQGFPSAY